MYSAVITAYREEKTVGRVIESFLKELPKNSEIFVVAPDDETLKVAREYSKKSRRVKFLKDRGKGKPSALNLAFSKVSGKIIILTDGDVVIEEGSVRNLLKHFKDKKVGIVSGRVVYLIPEKSIFYEWAKLSERVFDKMRKEQDRKGEFWHPTGYLYALRRNLVERIPSNSLSDDAVIGYLVKSKGYLVRYEPRAVVYIKFPLSIRDFIKQKSRTRAGFLQLRRWFGFFGRRISSEISLGFRDLFKIYGFKKFYKMVFVGLIYLISWIRAYWLIYRGASFKKIWERVESTK
ncbi:MAG: glycosyltransferase [Candidatus Aenigmarchaeota archaeon]|nr:glycosyltransferase [Candidatus Aenigmarchaeota archaeon]